MLLCLDEARRVVWYNLEIDELEAKRYLSHQVVWVDIAELPTYQVAPEGRETILRLSEDSTLEYIFVAKEPIDITPTEFSSMERIMQSFTDMELMELEGKDERALLGQQLTDLELMLLEGR